jgi:hypothetical protein
MPKIPSFVQLEPAASFHARLDQVQHLTLAKGWVTGPPHIEIDLPDFSLAPDQTPFRFTDRGGQGARGTCWAFAGVAALEAAYRRKYGVSLDLSEQYLFHILKAHESDAGNHSLIGFQGSSDVVRHLHHIALPEERYAPYLDQAALLAAIPAAQALSMAANPTQEQRDLFEFDETHIPLAARWNARYRVASSGVLSNFTIADLEQTLGARHEVVVNVKVVDDAEPPENWGGHVLLLIGYNRFKGYFLAKNSWGESDFIRIQYQDDPTLRIDFSLAHYITDVVDPQAPAQTQAFWVGKWNMDHDGWRGELVVRRFTDVRQEGEPDNPAKATKLGSYYLNGKKFAVNGYFEDAGQSMKFHVPTLGGADGQHFTAHVFGRDPLYAAGRTVWQGTDFGLALGRRALPSKPSNAFSSTEWIGMWDMNHDGWRGFLRNGAPSYYINAEGKRLPVNASMPHQTSHLLNARIDFAPDNRQPFALWYHTREDGLFSGTTTWNNRRFGALGFKLNPLLFYDGQSGSGAIAFAGRAGCFTPTFYPPHSFAAGWSHVAVGAGQVLFYNAGTGEGAVARFSTDELVTLNSYGKGSFAPGWTHVVATGDTTLFYQQASGAGMVGRLVGKEHVSVKSLEPGAFLKGWTHIVASDGYVLFYKQGTGEGALGSLNPSGFTTLKSFESHAFDPGWTHVAATNGLVLFYNQDTGAGAVGQIAGGTFTTLHSYGPKSFAPGWTHVALTSGIGLFYRKTSGEGAAGEIRPDGFFTTRTFGPNSFARTWSLIVG